MKEEVQVLMDRLAGELEPDRAAELIQAGVEPLRDLIARAPPEAAGGRAPPPACRAARADLHSVSARMRWQAEWCDRLGSPLYGELLRRAGDDAEAGGAVAEALAGHEDDPLESMLQLRFMGAVHRLALAGRAPELAAVYPSCGGSGAVAAAWPAFRATVADRLEELDGLVRRPVQTNEVGRSRALALGLPRARFRDRAAAAAARARVERRASTCAGTRSITPPAGSSSAIPRRRFSSSTTPRAHFPHCPGTCGSWSVRAATRRRWPSTTTVASRCAHTCGPTSWTGCARSTARSQVAAGIPVSVERSGAADWLERRLAEPADGRVHGGVPLDRHAVRGRRGARPDRRADRRGGRARHESAPLARLALEPGGELAELRLTVWPGGEERVLAHAGYHGEPVRWEGG